MVSLLINAYLDKIRTSNQQRLVFALLFPTIILVVTALVLLVLSVQPVNWVLPITITMLLGNFVIIYTFHLSYEELGLSLKKESILMHTFGFILLVVFVLLSLLIANVDIKEELLKFSWVDILAFTIAALADEIYFRGIIYRLLEVWDEKTAFVGSSLIFGFWTIQVGYFLILPSALTPIERIIFALGLSALRYTSKMIFLTIPAHIVINVHNAIMQSTGVSNQLALLSYVLLLIAIGILLGSSEYVERRKEKGSKPVQELQ